MQRLKQEKNKPGSVIESRNKHEFEVPTEQSFDSNATV